jgi:ATP-dependent DNA helicase RecG
MEDSFIIKNLLEQPKGERFDLNATVDYDVISQVITSFINTKGGDLLIGINDDKTVSDIDINDDTCRELVDFLIHHIKPTAPILANVLSYKKKNVILVSVWEGADKPYSFRDHIYVRQGTQTKISSDKLTVALLNQQVNSEQRWERQAVLGSTIKDLDLVEIRKSIEAYTKYSSNELINDPEHFLVSRGLIVNGNITNAGMLLFGKNPTQFLPQSQIKLVVHPSNTSSDTFIENKIYDGNIFQNFRNILTDFDVIIGKVIKIEGIYRSEKKKYPEKALREGLLNAIVHREYGVSKSFLTIAIYSDRLVISNYGGLQDNMTVKDLQREHDSILRNPDIAQMCFYNELIEMLGSGTLRMIRSCKAEGYKIPKWKNNDNILELTYHGISHQNEGVIEGANEGVSEGVKLNIEGVNEGVKEELSLLYHQIAKHPGKKANELNEQINKSIATTERYIKLLKEHGLIEFKGAPKTGGYFLIQ